MARAATQLGASGLSATGVFSSPQDFECVDDVVNGRILSIYAPMETTGDGAGNPPLGIVLQTNGTVTLNNVIGVDHINATQGNPTVKLKGSNSIGTISLAGAQSLKVEVTDGIATNTGSLNIRTGVTLTITSGATLNNSGMITNSGTIDNTGTIDNSGKIYSRNNIEGITNTGGTVEIISMLTFTYSPDYDIPASAVSMAIVSIDVKPGVSEGKTPYTFAAVGLPDGITIDPTTGIISGAPTTEGPAGTATITVTDDLSATAEITITYSAVGPADGFISVTGITGVPTAAVVGTPLTLTGTVKPDNATNKTPIIWTVTSQGTTGATITGNTLTAATAGTVKVTATIENGLTPSIDYTKDFDITVRYPSTSSGGCGNAGFGAAALLLAAGLGLKKRA
ncbi:hypothetical protein FACS1894187_22690 [Synergistales bacterium]|nr:hypothetical protein FACS1894187_22690 [Synergistales bacterium]